MSENRRMKISDLHPHPKNAEIYGMDEDVSDLVEKIKRSGQVHTLVVTSKGIVLAGGGALIRNLDKLLSSKTGMPVYIAEDPLDCVAKGACRTLEDLEKLKTVLINSRRRR